jgi:hypothetical protein
MKNCCDRRNRVSSASGMILHTSRLTHLSAYILLLAMVGCSDSLPAPATAVAAESMDQSGRTFLLGRTHGLLDFVAGC